MCHPQAGAADAAGARGDRVGGLLARGQHVPAAGCINMLA
jgi:hypothetical protein